MHGKVIEIRSKPFYHAQIEEGNAGGLRKFARLCFFPWFAFES